MSNSIGKRIKLVRETIGLKREEFSVETGIPIGTLIGIEQGRHEPKSGILSAIAQKWPQYATYLLTDETHVKQENPELGV